MIGDTIRLLRSTAVGAIGALPVVGPTLAPPRHLEIDGSVVFITAPMTVEDAAAAVVSGIERRAPRVSAPAWVAPLMAVRSLTTTVMDQVLLTNPDVARAIGAAEAEARG